MKGVRYLIERDTGLAGWSPDSVYSTLAGARRGFRYLCDTCPTVAFRLVRVERRVLREVVPPVSQAAGPVVGRRR